jgi:methanogenic corrinoid protein MtbC1
MGADETTFPLRVAVRMTGLSAERLRAWEARHAVVEPIRTPGGSRRYRASDLERLRLLREAVDAGHRIGDLVGLDLSALRACKADPAGPSADPAAHEEIWAPLTRLDGERVRELFEQALAAMGPLPFARQFVVPFLHEVGRRWAAGELSIAAEHLASALLSSMLVGALRAHRPAPTDPSIVFATPAGEPHALGLCIAALAAAAAGAAPIYVGADVPEDDLVESVGRSRAEILALALVTLPRDGAEAVLRRLRRRLPSRIEIWTGGAGSVRCAPIRGVVNVGNLDQLASHVALRRLAIDSQGIVEEREQ